MLLEYHTKKNATCVNHQVAFSLMKKNIILLFL